MLLLTSFVSVLRFCMRLVHTLRWVVYSFEDLFFFLFEGRCACLLNLFSFTGSSLLPVCYVRLDLKFVFGVSYDIGSKVFKLVSFIFHLQYLYIFFLSFFLKSKECKE